MDETVQSPTKPGIPDWLPKFEELRSMGVPVKRICEDHIRIPRSTLYAALDSLKKAGLYPRRAA